TPPRATAPAPLSHTTLFRSSRAEPLRRMLADGDWDLDPAMRERSNLLLDYLQEVHDLIPDDLPLLGQLDDALLVELAWDSFAAEDRKSTRLNSSHVKISYAV